MFKPVIHNLENTKENQEVLSLIESYNSQLDYKERFKDITPLERKVKLHRLAKEQLEIKLKEINKLLEQTRDKESLNKYLDTLSPMQRGNQKKTLETTQGFSGDYMPRYKYIEQCINQGGYYIENNRFYKPNGCFYDIKGITRTAIKYFNYLNN